MDYRAQVYSPLQNLAIWLGAWLADYVATDECLGAVTELGGAHLLEGEHPEVGSNVDFLKLVRNLVDEPAPPTPPLSLVLCGPGDAPRLPVGSAAYAATIEGGLGALVMPQRHAGSHILVPQPYSAGLRWQRFTIDEPLPPVDYLSPGDADRSLAEATRAAADLIEAMGDNNLTRNKSIPDPRLTVGHLSDFYDVPGLPLITPPRAAKLFARADRVAAIIETVQSHVGDHSLDPQLISLWRHIRAARVAGVTYALQEFQRG
ncbi:hypothetical protein [Corynebacterium epidermidicanis]|uniref:Uncharacterized protein n=1 Tax=Corynebacterium epidermidicanis TaxID=1050174 RepID=A0A0G3GRI9_9CORY|nr:hypothetical protein [Corynebacterium epidermidicanis]AKK03175.1 hypothetical protein CEPID_06585 [Corynebacterium epidermidicanis]